MAIFFMIEILFNMFEGGVIEILEFDNLYLVLIIFEIYWRVVGNDKSIIFDFIHVTFLATYSLVFKITENQQVKIHF